MGSLVSPSIAIARMEDFEEQALATTPNSPQVWYHYVDDTFTVLHMNLIEEFTNHINSLNPQIKFTIEEQDGRLPFRDICINVNNGGTLRTTIYRKTTHTDQYLDWKSNHHLEHKRFVVRTLLRRAETVVFDLSDCEEEVDTGKRP